MMDKERKTRGWGMLFLFMTLMPCAYAQDSLSLPDAILLGLEQNYQIRISTKNAEIAANNNSQGAAGRYPSINLGVQEINRYAPIQGNYEFNSATLPFLNMNWKLFDGFGITITKKRLDELQTFAEGQAMVVVETTLQGIILAYYNILLQEEKLRVLQEVKDLSRDRLAYNNLKRKLGAAVTYDVLQAQDAFLTDSSNFLLQELELYNAYLYLNLILGVDQEQRFVLTDSFTVQTPDYKLDSLMERMLRSNSNIRNQYINQRILQLDKRYERSQIWPELNLNAGSNQFQGLLSSGQGGFFSNLDYYANFTLSFNLWNGGNTMRLIRNATIREEIGQLESQDLERSLSNALVNQFELYNIRKQLYEVALESEETARLNLKISTDKFRSGAINSFNFRDVQRTFLLASQRKLEAVYNLIDTHTELLRLTGGMISEARSQANLYQSN